MSEIEATVNLKFANGGGDSNEIELCKIIINTTQLLGWISNNQESIVNSPVQNKLLTTEELAEFLQKSISTIRNWKRIGLIPYQRIGRSIFFNVDEVQNSIKKINNSVYNRPPP